ncbi:hypothetical protein SAMN05216207_101035 [Pseudonocardia ammonioxydans]|uniref:Uncharacterized protein n=1 Tax=Pseudonocardia ammonioxydans TaxID=260086 RepID=A0A1I4X4T8_PSUAM|nr:hypothetical protein [Pseudonocardia ammonioxydans]SFN20513.1 hypothetical protein SAMN05216207_101035 [Pseudonocardia ammonioxydans]
MAVRWRTRRTAPAPADDGRWGVARLVAQREAERRSARERAAAVRAAPVAEPGTEEPAAPAADPVDQGELTVEPAAETAVEPAAEPAAAEEESTPDTPRSSSVDSVPAPRPPRTPEPAPAAPPRPRRPPERTAPGPHGPRRPRAAAADDGPVYRPPAVSARPRVDLEPGLVGFSRLTRGRTGSRVFTLFFVGIYLVIIVHTLSTIV